jgi:hypothetical protein
MVIVNVDGKDYDITESQEKLMLYVQEAMAIEQGGVPILLLRSKSQP